MENTKNRELREGKMRMGGEEGKQIERNNGKERQRESNCREESVKGMQKRNTKNKEFREGKRKMCVGGRRSK